MKAAISTSPLKGDIFQLPGGVQRANHCLLNSFPVFELEMMHALYTAMLFHNLIRGIYCTQGMGI